MVEIKHIELISVTEGSVNLCRWQAPPNQQLSLSVLMDPAEASSLCVHTGAQDHAHMLVTLARGQLSPETLGKTLVFCS